MLPARDPRCAQRPPWMLFTSQRQSGPPLRQGPSSSMNHALDFYVDQKPLRRLAVLLARDHRQRPASAPGVLPGRRANAHPFCR